MTEFGSRWKSGPSGVNEPGEGDSLKLIPAWSVALAITIFVGSMFLFNYNPNPPRQPSSTPPTTQSTQTGQPTQAQAAPPRSPGPRGRNSRSSWEIGHLIFLYTTSAALASYMLVIGYVSRDVKRRNMSAPLWMLIVLVMPGGIGAIVYFLLRQPMMTRCPHCTTELTEGVHFCPQCRFQVAPVCGQCFRGVQITDAYCPQCGHDVAEDPAPARLRAYSDS
jgi:hypothetical protein